ncbi:MAG TPA: prenyltransferase/squalene oxidase repeat-containing protein [Planctomycetota bacterium]|nr:prenyltransferase/squalene oxidase repeat-containing protein [Planctomycetota bacterium]
MNRLNTGGSLVHAAAPREALPHIITAAPSWLGSAVLHVIVLLLFCQVQWSVENPPAEPIVVTLDRDEPLDLSPDVPPDPIDYPIFAAIPPDAPIDQRNMNADDIDDDVVPGGDELPEVHNPIFDHHIPTVAVLGLASTDSTTGGLNPGIGPGKRPKGPYTGRTPDPDIDPGLQWLARVQEPDGRWDSMKWGANHNCDAGVTGLAVLAFLADGNTDRSGRYFRNVYLALRWLEKRQASDGGFGERFYSQGICTMAVAQAHGMSGTATWRGVAQKALDFCCANQNPNGGWDYMGNNPNRVDTSVSAWMVLALKSGIVCGLNVPDTAVERVRKWLRESINADGNTGYTKNIGAQGSSNGTPAMTAAATLCRQFMGWKAGDPEITRALGYIEKNGVQLNNLYHTYYATLAMFQVKQFIPRHWQDWRKNCREPLLARQVKGKGKDLDGSWDPDTTYGAHGGRVYTTAVALFCLEGDRIYLPMLK